MDHIYTILRKLFTTAVMASMLLFMFGAGEQVHAQYDGTGLFTEITSIEDLEDGYYVVANEDGEYAMNNTHTGSFFTETEISPSSGEITNPDGSIVWYIEVDGSGKTVYNEDAEVYVGYGGSGNSSSAETSVSDAARWTITYESDEFVFTNVDETERVLRYNTGNPRFAAYSSSFGQNLKLYKYEAIEDPIFATSPNSLSDLDYEEDEGPSSAQSFTVSGSNLDGTDATVSAPSNFEISENEEGTYGSSITLTSFDGSATTLWIRLTSGLAVDEYSGNVTISGGGADNATVAVSGEVTPEVPDYDFTETFETGNFNLTGSYSDGSFEGVTGVIWSYVASRDEHTYPINGDNAIMLRRVSDNSSLTSNTISGGIDEFSVLIRKGFTGSGDRQVELLIGPDENNLVSYGTSEAFDVNDEIRRFTVTDIGYTGDFVMRIANIKSGQIVIDDISWIRNLGTDPLLTAFPSSLSNFNYIEGEGPSSAQSFEVSGANLDESNVTVTAPANFEISENEESGFGNSITFTSFDGTETTIYTRLEAGLTDGDFSGDIAISGGGADSRTVSLSGNVTGPKSTTLPYSEDFASDLGDLYTFSVFGDTREWEWNSNGFAEINGFGSGEGQEDWLVLPAIDADAADNPILTFDSEYQFGEDESGGNNYLKLHYSSDYSGMGDPSGATWTELTFNQPSESGSFESSGNVNLSEITGSSIYLAFEYNYLNGDWRRWRIDNIEIQDLADPILSVPPQSLSDLEYLEGSGPSTAQSFQLSGSNMDGSDVIVTAPSNFEVSETEEGTYENSITYTAYDGSEETAWVRLSGSLAVNEYSGNITISGGGAASESVAVSGEVKAAPPSLATGYEEDFSGFVSAETIPNGWGVSNTSYNGDWGSGTGAGLRGSASVLGFQHTGSTGTFTATLELLNDTGDEIENLNISYMGKVERADQGRSPEWNVKVNGTEVDGLFYSTFNGVDRWVQTSVTGLSIPDNSTIEIEWSSERGDGGGSSKQIGISDVSVEAFTGDPVYETLLTGNEGFRMLTTPVTATFGSFLDPIWTQGASNANYPGGSPNVLLWDNTSSDRSAQNWDPVTNLSGNITPGTGILVYVYEDHNYDGSEVGFPRTLSVAGTENEADITPDVNSNADGFTLLGNPFASTIDWDEVGSSELTGTIYIWDPGSNAWKSYAEGAGEHDGKIAPFQGFFVQTDESPTDPSVTFTDAAKSTGGELQGKQNKQERHIVRLELNGEELQSSTWMRFSENGSLDKQVRGDALKLQPLSNNFAQLATYKSDEKLYDISHLPFTDEAINIPLHVSSTAGGTFTLRATDFELPEGFELTFNDHATGESVTVTHNFEYQIELGAAKANDVPPLERLTQEPMVTKASPETAGYSFTAQALMGTNVEDPYGQLPEQVTLNQNYPNPFNPSTTISYQLPENSHVTLKVFDMLGRQVATLVDGQVSAGTHQATFDAGNLSSGMYIYRLQAGNTVITKKLTLIK